MPFVLVWEGPPDVVIVALMVRLALMDALAARGCMTGAYGEQFPPGAVGQLSFICQQEIRSPKKTPHHTAMQTACS